MQHSEGVTMYTDSDGSVVICDCVCPRSWNGLTAAPKGLAYHIFDLVIEIFQTMTESIV